MSDWLERSYMARLGVAKGREGRRHQLDRERQGAFHYVYGPYAEPVLTIDPGDIVVAETEDAFGGAIRSERDLPSAVLNMPFVNPQCGPIRIEGAKKGDVVAVRILDIEPRGPQPVGTTALIPEFGGLVATPVTAMLNRPLPERVKKMAVTREGVVFNERITLPYEPFIGTLGVSPEIEAISSLTPKSPMATITIWMPSRSSGMPMVKRVTPVVRSIPMVPSISPVTTIAIPFSAPPLLTAEAAISPSRITAK